MSDIPVDSAFCYSCSKQTNHQILATHSYHTDPNDYYMVFDYQIIRCMGCSNYAFRFIETDVEELRYYPDEERELYKRHHQREKIYPKNIQLTDDYWDLPKTVHDIYSETLLAIQETSYILAAIGLRTTLEAICQDKNVSGNDLEQKIEQLYSDGWITERDFQHLHAIRFLGNDAAHEIAKAEKHQIQAALKIIEHLIESLYILEGQISGKLEIVYEKFIEQLKHKIKTVNGQFTLSNLFTEEKNIFTKKLPEYQERLITDIKNGKIKFLQLSNDENLPFQTIPKDQ